MTSKGLHLRQSVRVRITLAAAVVTALAVGMAGWLLLRSLENRQLDDVRDDMQAQLDRVADRLAAGDDPQDAIGKYFDEVGGFVEVVDVDGDRVAGPPGVSVANTGPLPDDKEEEVSLNGAIDVGGDTISGEMESISKEVVTPSGETYTVVASAPIGQVAQVVRSVAALRDMLLVGLPGLVLLVAVVAWVLVGRALRPVEAIRAEVDAITGSTIHRRVPEPPTHDEIGRLARTMNAMLGRLDDAATQQRQFVSDASHELRSPVAAIRTGLEVARHKGDRANWSKVADTALAEEARLEALLDDLLLLATADENGAGTRPETTVDLATLVHTEAERPRRLTVHVLDRTNGDPRTAATVAGAASQLTRVIGNLLDNAARHAATAVQVTVVRRDDTVHLLVDDDGPGVPTADRERIFERFTRLDDGRSRGQGGSGLGLAVVRSLVTRHHGHVRADESPLGGARFVVELPARAAPTPGLALRPAVAPGPRG